MYVSVYLYFHCINQDSQGKTLYDQARELGKAVLTVICTDACAKCSSFTPYITLYGGAPNKGGTYIAYIQR